MACYLSCAISAIFIIGMIYFYNATTNNKVVMHYKNKLPTHLQELYESISRERRNISIQGYILGFIISLAIIYYNLKIKTSKLTNTTMVCIVLSVSFITNYFYYMLSPKSKWMLDHINNREHIKAWLQMYRTMQYHYHLGLVLGLIGVGIFTFAFRC